MHARSSAHAVNVNGQITVIGGNDGLARVKHVEVLNRKKKCWEVVPWYASRRCRLWCALLTYLCIGCMSFYNI